MEAMETVNVRLDQKTTDKLYKMTKKELIEKLCVASLEANVANRSVETLSAKLDKSESYVEQGRAMIESVMERWHEYDT